MDKYWWFWIVSTGSFWIGMGMVLVGEKFNKPVLASIVIIIIYVLFYWLCLHNFYKSDTGVNNE